MGDRFRVADDETMLPRQVEDRGLDKREALVRI
jgi:hypothetical protein